MNRTNSIMKQFGIFLIIFAASFSMNGQTKKWTLKECVEHALENNISVKQSELDLEGTEAEKLSAIGNFIPSINGNATYSTNTGANVNPVTNAFENQTFESVTIGGSVGLNIFDGLRNIRQLQRAKLSKLAAEYQLSKMKDDISLFVANAYLQVLNNKANFEVLKSQNEVTQEQISRTRELVEAGVLPQGDLLEIEATDATEKQSIVNAENQVAISLLSLAQLLRVEDYQTFDISDEDYEIIDEGISARPVSEIVDNAKENRSEIKIAEKNVELAEKDLQIARGAYYPTLSAFFSYNTRYSDPDFLNRSFTDQLWQNDGTGYGLRLSIPVLNGFSARSNVMRNRINLERSKYQLDQAELDLESTIYQAYVDAKGSYKSYEAAQKAMTSQQLAYEYAKERYDVGLTNAFDFSQSKNRYDNARIEANRTKYDYIFRLKVLELYFGIPATELKF